MKLAKSYDAVHKTLRNKSQWVAWKKVGSKKIPYIAGIRRPAQPFKHLKDTYISLKRALQALAHFDGLGFFFLASDELLGIDLDHCVTFVNQEEGPPLKVIAPWAVKAYELLGGYTEYSVNDGLHIYVYGAPPEGWKTVQDKKTTASIDMWDSKRYFTVTGDVVYSPERLPKVGTATLQELATLLTPAAPKTARPIGRATASTQIVSKGGRSDWLYRGACYHWAGGASEVDVARMTHRANETACDPPLGKQEVKTIIASAFRNHQGRRYDLTEEGNVARLLSFVEGDIAYVAEWKAAGWLNWGGQGWERGAHRSVLGYISHATTSGILEEAQKAVDGEDEAYSTLLLKWLKTSNPFYRQKNVLTRAEAPCRIDLSLLDAKPFLFRVSNGTLELRENGSAHLRPSRKQDYLTLCANTEYDPDAGRLHWDAFLEEVLPDLEVRKFIQRLVGYGLTGSVEEQILTFLYGKGANGKSTFIEALMHLFGDYGVKASAQLLMRPKAGATPALMSVKGRRFVATPELEEKMIFPCARIKELTGGDTLTGRNLYQNFSSFEPTHKLFIYGNYKPRVTGTTEGIWRRLKLVPFEVQIKEADQNKQLLQYLKSEAAGILNWALEGYKEWRTNGLQTPATVTKASDAYRSEEDLFSRYIEETCLVDPENKEYRAIAKQLKNGWYHYYRDYGNDKPTWVGKPERLRKLGCVYKQATGGKWYWFGITFRSGVGSEGIVINIQ